MFNFTRMVVKWFDSVNVVSSLEDQRYLIKTQISFHEQEICHEIHSVTDPILSIKLLCAIPRFFPVAFEHLPSKCVSIFNPSPRNECTTRWIDCIIHRERKRVNVAYHPCFHPSYFHNSWHRTRRGCAVLYSHQAVKAGNEFCLK